MTGTNGASGTVTGVSVAGGVYTVTVANISGTGALILGLNPASDIADAAGNLATLTPASRDVAGPTDTTIPVLSADINQTVTHSEAITGNLLANDVGSGLHVTSIQFAGG